MVTAGASGTVELLGRLLLVRNKGAGLPCTGAGGRISDKEGLGAVMVVVLLKNVFSVVIATSPVSTGKIIDFGLITAPYRL